MPLVSDKNATPSANRSRAQLRTMYALLCVFQLIVIGAVLFVAYGIAHSYSSNIDYEGRVNAQRRELATLQTLADAAAPPNPEIDNAEWDEEFSRVSYAVQIFDGAVDKLLAETQKDASSPLAKSEDQLQALKTNMNEVRDQTKQAQDNIGKGKAQLWAHLTYADRAISSVRTMIGNLNQQVSEAKDEILKEQARQVRLTRIVLAPLSALGLLMVLPAIFYARRLDKQMVSYEKELQAERDALEVRITERTVDLRQEMERRSWMEEFNRSRNQLMEMVAEGKPLAGVLEQLAQTVERSTDGARCVVVIQRRKPITAFSQSLPSSALNVVLKALAGNVGLFSQMRLERKPFFFTQQNTTNENLKALLKGSNVQAMWAVPVQFERGGVAGALMLLWRSEKLPTDREKEMLVSAAHLASVAASHSEMQEELLRGTQYDGLTGLPNLQLSEDRLNQALTRAKSADSSVALLSIELDHFKQINDDFGRDAGDRVLQEVGARVSEVVRPIDTVARIGGDEFIVVVEGAGSNEDITSLGNAIQAAINKMIEFEGKKMRAKASIGVAYYPADAASVDELKSRADMAMLKAKEQGGGTLSFYQNPKVERFAKKAAARI